MTLAHGTVRWALLTAALTMALVCGASFADTARAAPFDISTGTAETKGSARTWGHVTFLSRKSVRIRGRINDLCPADGYSANVQFRLLRGKGRSHVEADYSRTDSRTCKKKRPLSFDVTRKYKRPVRKVKIVLAEYDYGASPIGIGDKARVELINPKF